MSTSRAARCADLGRAARPIGACIDFIKRQHATGTPFFVWMNPTHMHLYTHTKPESLGQAGRWQSPYHDTMIDRDRNVGQLLEALDELGIAEDTIVIYSTDNGPHANSWPDGATTPFRSEKATNWEGAFRVPEIIRWPGRIPAGVVSNEIVQHHDWLPTFLAAAGEPDIVEKLKHGHQADEKTFKVHIDGYNLLPYLTGDVDKSPREGPPCHRCGADPAGGRRAARTAVRQRCAAAAHRRREHAVLLRRRTGTRPARNPVLRNTRQPRDLPQRLDRGYAAQDAVAARGRKTPAFDDDVWELYDTTEDWSQAKDLSKEMPDKLHELQRLWLIEATRYNVLPLDDDAATRMNSDLAGRLVLIKGNTQLLFSGMGRLSENCVLNMKNKSHSVTAEIDVPESGAEGVILAQGANIGGWSLCAKGGKLKYCYNLGGLQHFYAESADPIPAGTHQVRMEFAYAGGGMGKAAMSRSTLTARRSARARSQRPWRSFTRPTTVWTLVWTVVHRCLLTTPRETTPSAVGSKVRSSRSPTRRRPRGTWCRPRKRSASRWRASRSCRILPVMDRKSVGVSPGSRCPIVQRHQRGARRREGGRIHLVITYSASMNRIRWETTALVRNAVRPKTVVPQDITGANRHR
jgi:hypothetical protein